ncbi:opioid-binding protein/cell adhesion molecule homolog isoform X3 [Denticeps clupeoides]|uniref:opioid-binding protein/cell adhesion molecule homolog isoform X3 n=1 Tax=Denticeps clupeoides TaxID=299321 RepID=UPI0010A33E1F|nr:opioid-binding protein/cell adhesion molecule homolog isoform X3 [Denticeps clupeoides]
MMDVPQKSPSLQALRGIWNVQESLPVRSQGDSQSDNKVMDNVTVRQGETVFLSCAQGDFVTHTAWLNRSSILYAGEDKWSVDPRVSLVTLNQEEFSIKIENVDMTDEGQYICAVQTSSKPRTTSVHIIVQVPPKIMSLSKDIVVNEGSNVTLMCSASGKPEPSVTWKLLSPSGHGLSSDDEYLEIPAITRQRAGMYECTAVNEVSTDVQTVELTVNYAPSVVEGKDVGVTLGQRGVLQCEADAVPQADFEWYRDDRRIFNGFDGIEIEDDGALSKLTFFNVSEADYGNYTCVAINKLGAANTSIVLYEIIEPTSSTLLQVDTASVLEMTSSVLEKAASETYAILEGPGAVQDGNSATTGTHTPACLLLMVALQLLMRF